MLISGQAGVGKTSLARELQRAVAGAKGFFVSGKFDQRQWETPYTALQAAFGELVDRVLAEPDERLAVWRERLREAAGPYGRLLVEWLPHLGLILEKQPPAAEGPWINTRRRLHDLFVSFTGAFARREHPVALFLDDLHWADAATLRLIEHTVTGPEPLHLCLIGSYRDHEGPNAGLLKQTLDSIQGSVPFYEIHLGPLEDASLRRLLADTLRCEEGTAAPLADLIREHTGGNPLFVNQLLQALQRDGLIWFDREGGGWRWDMERIRGARIAGSVVDLATGRIARLPEPTQSLLRLAAHLGGEFDLTALAVVAGRPVDRVAAELGPAVSEGLVLECSDPFAAAAADLPDQDAAQGVFRWRHDRVRQAALSLHPPEQQARLHLSIGRALLGGLPPDQLADRLFDVVSQFNGGASLIDEEREQIRVAELNLQAGRKAMATAAYDSALDYLTAGQSLMPSGSWEAEHNLAYGLWLERARCQWVRGEARAALRTLEELMEQARGTVERAEVYRLKIEVHTTLNEIDQAIEAVRTSCRELFGLQLPFDLSREALRSRAMEVLAELGNRSIADLAGAPLMTDPEAQAALALLETAQPAAYFTHSLLHDFLACESVRLSLRHGHAELSLHGYMVYGSVLGRFCDRWDDAAAFAKLACDLAGRYRFPLGKTHAYFTLVNFVTPCLQSLRDAVSWCKKAQEAATACGEVNYIAYAAEKIVQYRLAAGCPLPKVIAEADRQLAIVRRTGFDLMQETILAIRRFLGWAAGEGSGAPEISRAFDARGFEAGLKSDVRPHLSSIYYLYKTWASLLAGDYRQASADAGEAGAFLGPQSNLLSEIEFRFLAALAQAAHHEQMCAAGQRGNLESLAGHQEQFRLWAAAFPANFAGRHALISAEIARIGGRDRDAMHLYEQAIRLAGESGFVHIEALAAEFAARFHQARGIQTAAGAYLRRARECYLRWGALAKVKLIDGQHPELSGRPAEESPRTFGARAEDLDALALVKATTAISGEIELEPLLDGLLRVTLEQAGAQRACLLILEDGGCATAAEARVVEQEIQVSHGFRDDMAPAALVNYVRRTAEKVLLDDAAAPHSFSGDEYFSRVRPRSVLCLPILRQSRAVAVLYLENNLSDHAFTAERSAALDLLAAQAAISLENSRLYRSLRRENEERRKAEADLRKSQQFLQAILDRSTAVIFVKDANGRYLLANRRFLELFGCSEETLIGGTDFDVFPRELAEGYRLDDRMVLESAQPRELEDSVFVAGELRTYLALKFPLLDAEGKPFAVCGIAPDTERKALEEQLQRSQKLEAIGQLAGGVAHDFNNLLTVINGYSAMLLARDDVAGRTREHVEQIQGAGQRAASLTSQLLAFSRRQVLQPKVLDLNQVVRNLEKMLRRLIGEDIELITRLDPAPQFVRADAGQIEQVIVNLAVNARDAMPRGGQLFVELAEVDGGVAGGRRRADLPPGRCSRLTVRDTGCGIDSETLPRIFDPFFTTKPVGQGTGLGLSTVYGIVRQSGGQIEVESEPGKGSAFLLYLPRAEPEPTPQVPAGPPAVIHASETVLLVEDDANVRNLLAATLRERGYRVIEAASGKEALYLVEEHQGPVHVMVTDVVMPHMGGVELADRISPMHPETRVLLMSGYADRLIECKGGQSFLQKPFTPETLLERVQALCRPREL